MNSQRSKNGAELNFLYLTNDKYPPFRVDVSVLFGEEFSKKGHQISWIMQSEEPLQNNKTQYWGNWKLYLGATDEGTNFLSRMRKHLLGIRNDFRVIQVAKSDSFDFIQVKDKFFGALFGLWAAKSCKKPFYYWLSYPFPEASLFSAKQNTARYPFFYKLRGYLYGFLLYKIIARKADHVFVQSEQMKLDIEEMGIDPRKMTAVPMGFKPSTSPVSNVQIKPFQMVYLGTLLQTRKLDFLIRVLSIVKRSIPEATLIYVGPEELPGDLNILQKEAERLGVEDSVCYTGNMKRDDAFKVVAESAVCFSPFYPTPILNSTSPTKLVEYFSLCRPAVANDHPEQRKVMAESGGGYCVEYNEEAFADAAIKLINSPEKAKEMGKAGYNYAMKHRTYSVLADSVESKYHELLRQQQ